MENEKGSIIPELIDDFEYKKQIAKTPVQELKLKPGYTFKDLLDDVAKIEVLETENIEARIKAEYELKLAEKVKEIQEKASSIIISMEGA